MIGLLSSWCYYLTAAKILRDFMNCETMIYSLGGYAALMK